MASALLESATALNNLREGIIAPPTRSLRREGAPEPSLLAEGSSARSDFRQGHVRQPFERTPCRRRPPRLRGLFLSRERQPYPAVFAFRELPGAASSVQGKQDDPFARRDRSDLGELFLARHAQPPCDSAR